jgi:opacity protein-like surface antigen
MKRLLLIAFYCLIASTIAFAQTDTTVADTTKAAAPAVTPVGTPVVVPVAEAPESMESEGPSGSWNIVALGGWTFPYEPDEFKDQFEGSYNAGVGIAHLLPPGEDGYGEVSLMVNYYNFSFNETDFRTAYGVPTTAKVYGYEGDVYTGMIQFRGAYGKMNEGVAPYFTAAFGLYHIALPALGVEGQPEPIVPEYEKTTIGWSVGLGCDVAVTGNVTLFADGKFLLGVTETNGHKVITAGAGLRYKL